MTLFLIPLSVLFWIVWSEKGGWEILQKFEKEDADDSKFQSPGHFQTHDFPEWKDQDEDICEDRESSRYHVKGALVDALAALNRLISVERDWLALEDDDYEDCYH